MYWVAAVGGLTSPSVKACTLTTIGTLVGFENHAQFSVVPVTVDSRSCISTEVARRTAVGRTADWNSSDTGSYWTPSTRRLLLRLRFMWKVVMLGARNTSPKWSRNGWISPTCNPRDSASV